MSSLLHQVFSIATSFQKQKILNTLPVSGDKQNKGLTRKQIVQITGIPPKKVSQYLQTLRKQGARSFHGKWRQTRNSALTW
jgi:hypothetical protein